MNLYKNKLDMLAFQFFKLFARFEYALKASGYHKGDNKAAEPDWDTFAKNIDHIFASITDKDIEDAVEYMLRNPPKKQFIRGGKLIWEESTITGITAHRLLLYVRRIRNNLFHGGKFNGEWFDPERSEILLRHSIAIIEVCRDKSEKVKIAYDHY